VIVAVALEHRFERTPDGRVWTQTFFGHSFWRRYLDVFEGVRVIARVREVPDCRPEWAEVTGPGVVVWGVQYYVGPLQYLLLWAKIRKSLHGSVQPEDALILRVSSQISNVVRSSTSGTKRPFAVEVVADPYEVFGPGAVQHPLRPFLRWWFPLRLREQCRRACAAAYVTAAALQKRYPPSPTAFTTYYSSVELTSESFTPSARRFSRGNGVRRLVMIGTMDELYKGHDTMLQALRVCLDRGCQLFLTLVGGGRRRSELETEIARLKLEGYVEFAGILPSGAAVRNELDHAEIFVLPSRQEGLPRAMVEAMARALPCLGSTVGGIPELLNPEEMIKPGDHVALADAICKLSADADRLDRLSEQNWRKARDYQESVLRARRVAFYQHLRTATEAWNRGRATDSVAKEFVSEAS
jgi:glycosyltransferase involved in cell wall biosynthesis